MQLKFHIGRWYVKNIKPTPTGEAQEVKIKVRINANGVISLTSANLVEKKLKEEIPIDNGNGETNNMEVGQEVCIPLHISLIIYYAVNRNKICYFYFNFFFVKRKNKPIHPITLSNLILFNVNVYFRCC